jgi:nitrate/TMAO reductase-like tetraheme cytochrome c subunit
MMKNLTQLAAALCVALISTQALADRIGMPGNMPKSYLAECASCHTPYAPGLLPAKSWSNLMGSLDKHFGADAAIDAKSAREISAWLQANAATSRKFAAAAPDNRITSGAWFAREHREVGNDAWLRASIKSRANCGACHLQAARGDFNEDNVRIPR